MKKPVRKTPKEIEAIAAKRKNKMLSMQLQVPSGDLANFVQVTRDFAAKHGVKTNDLRLVNRQWGGTYLVAKVLETDEQKLKRVRIEEADKFRNKTWEYQAWERQEAYRMAQEARRNAATQCCPANCCCRRKGSC
jgi:hypothetical protein